MEIITYANVQLLAGILRGVAYIFGGDDFRSMLIVVGFIGFLVALVAYAFQPQKLVGWYWIATVLCVSAALVAPKTRVQLIDRLQDCSGGGCVTVVENVPYGLAVVASVTSRIGDKLAEMFETTFSSVTYSIPEGSEVLSGFPELNYRANGLMFGSKIVREATRVSFPSVNYRFNLTKYLDNCAGPDMSDGTIDPDAVRSSTDIWETLGTGGNPARFTPTAGGVVMSCAALRSELDSGMAAEITAATNMLGRRLNSDALADGNALSSAGAQARVGSQVSQAYLRARLGDAATDASTFIRQNAMINAMGDAAALRSQRTNDPTAIMVGMAEAQAKVSTNTSWITGAKVAEEAMPLIRNGIEAILYASFPVIVLMTLVVTGRTAVKLVSSYASTLLWIQLWPVLYAVLNYMATAAASRHLAAAGAMPSGVTGLSLLTSASIYENSISDVAVVGYLVVSIPVIAWSLVKGMEAIGAGALAGASAFTGGAGIGASQAATGNVSMGNVRTDDVRLHPHYGRADFSTQESADWSTTRGMLDSGPRWGTAKKSDLGEVGSNFIGREADTLSKKAEDSFGTAQREQTAMRQTMDSTFSKASTMMEGEARASLESHGTAVGKGGMDAHGSGSSVGSAGGSGNNESAGSDSSRTLQRMVRDTNEPWLENVGKGGGDGIGGGGKYNDAIVHNDKLGQAYGSRKQVMDSMARAETAHDAKQVWDEYKKSDEYKNSHETFKRSDDKIDAGLRLALSHEQESLRSMEEGHRLTSQADWTRSHAHELRVGLSSAVFSDMSDEERAGYSRLQREDPAAAARLVESRAHDHLDELYASSGGRFSSAADSPPTAGDLSRLPPSIEDDAKQEMTASYAAEAGKLDRGDVAADHAVHQGQVAGARAQGGLARDPHTGGNGGAGRPGPDAATQGIQKLEGEVADREGRLTRAEADARAKAQADVNAGKTGATAPIPEAQPSTEFRRDAADWARENVPGVKTVEDGYDKAVDWVHDAVEPDDPPKDK
jgi:hypothetical protein